jgi:hypothetical protein
MLHLTQGSVVVDYIFCRLALTDSRLHQYALALDPVLAVGVPELIYAHVLVGVDCGEVLDALLERKSGVFYQLCL